MASATATAKARKRARPSGVALVWPGSRVGRTIIALNVIGLVILVAGALVLNETRRALVDAQAETLRSQGDFIVNLLAAFGSTEGEPEPVLVPEFSRDTLLALQIPRSQRVWIFDRNGEVIADSYMVSDRIEQRDLPLIRPRGLQRLLPGDAQTQALERQAERAFEDLRAEADEALHGKVVVATRRTATGQRVVSVSMPIQYVEAVLGVLTIEGGDVDAIISRQRMAMMPFIIIAALVTMASSLLLNVVIARPVLRLARAADLVRMSQARTISLPDISRRDDELGDLGQSLETMTHTLSERMDAIERFAADVAHEIRNPLTSIRSAIETLDLVEDPAQRERLFGILKQDVARLDRLITDISNASRLDAELSRDEPKIIELDRLIGDIASLYKTTRSRSGAPVVFDPPARAMKVAGRETPLGQVIRNLIDNARSFTTLAGRKDASVRVRMRREDGEILVEIDDDGPGIPPENLETVFERFYTSRPREGRVEGSAGNSGLGLSIVRQITLAHNGRVWAENRTNEDGEIVGARFTVALPARN